MTQEDFDKFKQALTETPGSPATAQDLLTIIEWAETLFKQNARAVEATHNVAIAGFNR